VSSPESEPCARTGMADARARTAARRMALDMGRRHVVGLIQPVYALKAPAANVRLPLGWAWVVRYLGS
jgi:hypothetical protein